MIVAEIAGPKIALQADFRENDRIKLCPGALWNRKTRTWEVPLSWASCIALRGVFGETLTIGPVLTEWATRERERVDRCMALRQAQDVDPGWVADDPRDAALYPLQRVGVEFLVQAGSALMADPMGGGKTVQTIRALERQEAAYPVLVVCPSSMRWTWEREFGVWAAPGRTVSVVSGSAAARRKAILNGADVLVVNWESLYRHTRLASYGYVRLSEAEKTDQELNTIEFATVVADEAHRMKNPLSKQARAAWWLGDRARHRYALTGTPIANYPDDLWAVMRFVAPHEYPSKTAFINRYVEQAWSPFGFSQSVGLNAATREEFFRIFDPRMIRRPKELLVPGLPAKLPPQIREVELGTRQRAAYNSMRKDLLAELKSGVLIADNPLMKVLRLVQLASAYGDVDAGGNLTLTEPSCKIDALVEFLEEEMAGDSLVVFAESVQLLRLVAARLDKLGVGWAAVTGDVVGEARQASIDAFQSGEKQVILCSYGAGSEGITLTRASTVARLQRSWSLIKNAQSEDRVHRAGQTRDVTVVDFIAHDTVESRVRAAVENKEARLEELVRDEATLKAWLDK